MQTSSADQNIRSNNPVWYLFAEYSLSEIVTKNSKGDELTAGFLFQPFQELGVPNEWIGNIEMTLSAFAKKVLVVPFKQRRLEISASIRIFCQKKVIDDVNSTNASRPEHTVQTMEHIPFIDPCGTSMNGGWGYFIIERSGDYAGSSQRFHPFIDLYLYKEGE